MAVSDLLTLLKINSSGFVSPESPFTIKSFFSPDENVKIKVAPGCTIIHINESVR
jgi:hypothetical protein